MLDQQKVVHDCEVEEQLYNLLFPIKIKKYALVLSFLYLYAYNKNFASKLAKWPGENYSEKQTRGPCSRGTTEIRSLGDLEESVC